ncbi:MAG: metallophosphoesterase [Clostridia bacterium]|nr:metallophosphoesterase [Clostridia bacterium]
MIYLLSDLHGTMNFRGLTDYMHMDGKDDLLIILGDVGLNFENTDENREFTQAFLSIEKPIAFIDGNHENFAYLDSFPTELWNGGSVHRLSEHIVHLKRGNVYRIEDKSFFTFGGCKSSAIWDERGLRYQGEEAGEEECALARKNLRLNGYRVDYILTHKYETDSCKTISQPLLWLTKWIEQQVDYDRWFSGHWHRNQTVDAKHQLVYDELMAVC